MVATLRLVATREYVLMSNVTNVAVLALLTWGSLRYGLLWAAAQGHSGLSSAQDQQTSG